MENYLNEKVNDKKIDDFHFERQDFAIPSELTVTITLGEYRELVSKVATAQHDIKKANEDKWERDHRIEELEKLVTTLKDKLLEYMQEDEPIIKDDPAERGEF